MRILVVGGGGREHALCWKLKQTPGVELYCAPGNPGIEGLADLVPVAVEEIQQLAAFARDVAIDLTVVGPELPLALGIVDEFRARQLPIFGPSREAAQLEASKVFAKEFMCRHGIPTAEYVVAHDASEVRQAVQQIGLPLVMKADGLAAGKGVLIVRDEAALDEATGVFFTEQRFGTSGNRVLVEPFLEGEEVSFIGLADGTRLLPMATSKDYKRIGDNDSGPNTGGMGAHSPAGVLSTEDSAAIMEQVMRPTIAGMSAEGNPFVGVLYAGLMLTRDGVQVLEFNVRLGDPEAQPILMRLEDDLAELLRAGAGGDFGTSRLHFRKEAAACLVLASRGYPDTPRSDEPITGLDAEREPGVEVFHAGTVKRGGDILTKGGRVLNVCATGGDLRQALERAYTAAETIHWPSRVLRTDIGRRVLERTG